MSRATLGSRVIDPAPPAPCENPGLKPRRVSQFPQGNGSPCNAYPSHSPALSSRRGWPGCSSHPKAQLGCTLGWGTCPVCAHGLLISSRWVSLGRELGWFCCFGNENMQATSFSCVSQRTCLGWLNGAAVSINFLSFVSLCHNLNVV